MADKRIVAPRHLRAETKAWYRGIVEGYSLESHHLRLLVLACEAWDRHTEARELIQRDGLVSEDKYGQVKPHPGVQIEKDSRSQFVRCIRELGLDLAPDPPRPPITQPQRRR